MKVLSGCMWCYSYGDGGNKRGGGQWLGEVSEEGEKVMGKVSTTTSHNE